ncbi:MAG: hypothetical protein H6R10_473 [Rhodocyclaceae bacterium]|nr:hypothetical protein [Rhodocyclaceae bacterium]
MASKRQILFGISLALAFAGSAQARLERGGIECGGFTKAAAGIDAGPYDYRTGPADRKRQADRSYAQLVASSQGPLAQERLAADLDATLRLFPNHPRALMAMAELARQGNTDHPRGSRYSMSCWYDRAVRFAPDDVQMRLAYGYWLAKHGERTAAIEQLDQARASARESATLSYNLGLAYCEAGEYDKALGAAHTAYSLGHPLPGLRNRLAAAGRWREPVGAKAVRPVGERAAD